MENSSVTCYLIDENLMNESNGDITQPLQGQSLSQLDLEKINVKAWNLDGDPKNQFLLDIITKEGYKNQDECRVGKDFTPNYQELLEKFKTEHIHEDEEVRYFLDGSGYFDVRTIDDKWARIVAQKGTFIILPAGIYHRFTPDAKGFFVAMRVFKEEPKWTPINRPCEENSYRQQFLQSLIKQSSNESPNKKQDREQRSRSRSPLKESKSGEKQNVTENKQKD